MSRPDIGQFNDVRTSQDNPIIELNAVHKLSDLRDDRQTSGTGAITDETSEYRIRHQSSGDFASLRSASRGRYLPGHTAEVGVGIRLSSMPSSGDFKAEWGYFDMEVSDGTNQETVNDGFLFGQDKDGLYVRVVKSGAQKMKTYRSAFNVNNLGESPTDGLIFEIAFNYYGYGLVSFGYLEGDEGDEKQQLKVLHTWEPTGETSIDNTNLQVGGLVKSSNTDDDFSLFIGGRKFTIVGKYIPKTRIASDSRTGQTIGTGSFVPTVTIKRKQDRREVANEVIGYDALTDQDLIARVVVDANLNDTSFQSLSGITSTETAMEVNLTATSYSGGIKVYEGLVDASGQGSNTSGGISVDELPAAVPDEKPLTLSFKAIDSTATVDSTLRVKEEF